MTDPTMLREEIRRLRGELGDTVEALAAKASPGGLGGMLTARVRSGARQSALRTVSRARRSPGARRGLATLGAAGASAVVLRLLRRRRRSRQRQR